MLVWTGSVLRCQRKKWRYIYIYGCYPHFFMYLQVSIPSWKSTSLCSWSTPQASSKYTVSCPVVPLGFWLTSRGQTSFLSLVCPFDRCCLHRPVSVFRRRRVCAYVKLMSFYVKLMLFASVLPNRDMFFTGFMYGSMAVFFFFFTICVCVCVYSVILRAPGRGSCVWLWSQHCY